MFAMTPLTRTTSTMEEAWSRTLSKMVRGYLGVVFGKYEILKGKHNNSRLFTFLTEGKYFESS